MEVFAYGTSIVLFGGALLALCGAVMLLRVAAAIGAWFDRQMLERLVESMTAVILGDLQMGLMTLDDITSDNAHIVSLADSISQAMRAAQLNIDTADLVDLAITRIADRLEQRARHLESLVAS